MNLHRSLNLLVILALVSAFLASPAVAQQPDLLDNNQLISLTDGAPPASDDESLAQAKSRLSTGPVVPLVPVEGTTGPLPGWHESDSAPHHLHAAPQSNHILNTWGEGTPIPTGSQYQGAAVTIDNENFYLIGGYSTTYLDQNLHYNTTSGVWTTRAPMLLPRGNIFAYYNSGDGMIYVPGGWDGSYRNENHRYNPTTNTWEVLPPLPIAKAGANGGIVAGKLYLFGGNGGAETNETQVYNVASNSWSTGAPMPVTTHRYGGNVTYQEKIYVMGSFDAAHFLRYDPASNTWQQGPDMTVPRSSPNCLVTQDGIITCWGGGDGWNPRFNGEYYNLASWPDGAWTAIDDDPSPYGTVRAGHTCASNRLWVEGGAPHPYHDHNQWWDGEVSCYLGDDHIPGEWVNIGLGSGCPDFTRYDAEFFPETGLAYILGGRSAAETRGDIYTFDPSTESCQHTGVDLPTPVSNYTIATLEFPDGYRLCTFGGRDPAGNLISTVQCYSPAMNNVVTKADLPAAFDGYVPGGVEVVNNRAYIFGGYGPTTSPPMTNVTYEYNPMTDTYTAKGNLSLARSYMLTAVVNGKIYAFGGNTYDGANLIAETKAERFDPIFGTWNDEAVPDLPAASGEGRAFGFDRGTGHNLSGKIVLTGGGQWPGETAEALLYDPGSQTYNYSFPDLNIPRRNHAAFFQSRDALRMWVLGGRSGSDIPPYSPMEYYQIPFIAKIDIDPSELQAEVLTGTTTTKTLNICNQGDALLEWDLIIGADPIRMSVLIIQDQYPWGYSSIQDTLTTKGIDYDQIDSSQIPAVDLSPYALVIVPSTQPDGFYTNWNNNLAKFESYVAAGGALWLSTAAYPSTVPEPLLPGGVINSTDLDDYNEIVEPTHPWLIGVPDLIYGIHASHDSFTNLYPGSVVVARAQTSQNPTLVDYNLGNGRILITGQTLEFAWVNDWDAAPILQNSLSDMYYWAIASDIPWLSEDINTGELLPGECQQVMVTFDATGMDLGNYSANLLIFNNDPLSPISVVPVELIVVGPEEFFIYMPVAIKN